MDGSIREDGTGGWGFILLLRDSAGELVGSGAGRIEHCADAMQAEMTAALQALVFASEVGE